MKSLLILLLLLFPVTATAFDHSHATFDKLLQRYVHWNQEGTASRVDYTGLQKSRAILDDYLQTLSAVETKTYNSWSRQQQLAFLINAYNAFTINLILNSYPDLVSIKELGSFFRSPWKKKFFMLFGQKESLDGLEHEIIRVPGKFDEPRIHFAVVCASIGCPALRPEAFTAETLEEKLQDSTIRFLRDRQRNRIDSRTETIEISSIFKWYGEDFAGRLGHWGSLAAFLEAYREYLADDEQQRKIISTPGVPIHFLDYDWQLNDI